MGLNSLRKENAKKYSMDVAVTARYAYETDPMLHNRVLLTANIIESILERKLSTSENDLVLHAAGIAIHLTREDDV